MREREEEKGRSAKIGEGTWGMRNGKLGGKGEDSYLHGWNVTNLLNLACFTMSGNVGQYLHVTF